MCSLVELHLLNHIAWTLVQCRILVPSDAPGLYCACSTHGEDCCMRYSAHEPVISFSAMRHARAHASKQNNNVTHSHACLDMLHMQSCSVAAVSLIVLLTVPSLTVLAGLGIIALTPLPPPPPPLLLLSQGVHSFLQLLILFFCSVSLETPL